MKNEEAKENLDDSFVRGLYEYKSVSFFDSSCSTLFGARTNVIFVSKVHRMFITRGSTSQDANSPKKSNENYVLHCSKDF